MGGRADGGRPTGGRPGARWTRVGLGVTSLLVEVTVAAGLAELVTDELWSSGATGVEIRDGSAGLCVLVAGYPTPEAARSVGLGLGRRHPTRVVEVDDSWADAWRPYAEPVDAGSLVVVPAWRQVAWAAGRTQISIDPGRCFGGGSHPTTRLMLAELDRRLAPGASVLDVGTGSGILAVAAAALGAARVEAVDIDTDAVGVTMANAERNGVADRVAASAADIATLGRTFDLVVANLTAATLAALAADLVAAVAPGGWLLLSGMLTGQWTHVAGRFAALSVVDLPELDGWTGAVLRADRTGDRAWRPAAMGIVSGMEQRDDSDPQPSDEGTTRRAELLPEEQAAGSEDAHAQAEAILRESYQRGDDRERDRDVPAGSDVEHRSSDEATPPD